MGKWYRKAAVKAAVLIAGVLSGAVFVTSFAVGTTFAGTADPRSQQLIPIPISSARMSKECAVIKEYLDANYAEHITLDTLTRLTHMNKYYMAHSFAKFTAAEFLHKDLAVTDVVYNPKETLLLKKAKEAGCRAAVGGIGMLLWQGAAAFELFTGKEMPRDHFLYERKLQEQSQS